MNYTIRDTKITLKNRRDSNTVREGAPPPAKQPAVGRHMVQNCLPWGTEVKPWFKVYLDHK